MGGGGRFLTKSVDPVSRMTINVWPPMLNVWSMFQPKRDSTRRTLLYWGEVRATLRITLGQEFLPVHKRSLGDAQAVMIRNRELPREHVVSNPCRWSVEANAG